MFITASTVAIVRVYMLFLLVGLCYQVALQSSRKGVLSIIVSAILLFSGILTGFASKIAVNLYGAVERCLPLRTFLMQQILGQMLSWTSLTCLYHL